MLKSNKLVARVVPNALHICPRTESFNALGTTRSTNYVLPS